MDEIINKFNNIKITEKSQLVDKYLIPQELEKKKNAEVSTPYKLRQEMIDTIPVEFWSKKQKVFEPCSGKGGFLIDIIDKFLKHSTLTYKEIVEDCLYFSDINPTNIYINKLLLDPENKYKLNYNEGNTLELDIKVKWNLEGFDAVIGNPPYQEVTENGISKGGTNLYTKFINYSFINLNINGYLLFINPISFIGPSINKQSGNDILHNIFLKYDIIYVNINECKKYFNIGSTFMYYTLHKNISNIKTDIISEFEKNIVKSKINLKSYFKLKFLPIHITIDTLNLIIEIGSNQNKLEINRCRKLDSSNKKTKLHLSLIKTDKFKYITYHTKTKTYYSDIRLDLFDTKKIILNMSGYLNPRIVNEGNLTESKFYIVSNNDIELLKLLKQDNVEYYLKICKYSGFNSRKVIEYITY